jgi:cysteinyl-tRNA synthetase
MEKISLYDTLTRKKQEFKPLKKGLATFYYCGPTVYWTQHIGNLRGSFCADIVHRTLEYCGYKVKMVRNYTDVGHLTSDEDEGEDKMAKGAKREGVSPEEIAAKYIAVYEDDTRALNLKEPWKKPRATEHVKEMQGMVKVLMKKGFAYATPLAIYFDVSKFPNYTALSGQKLDKNMAGEGAGEVADPEKRNKADFAVWFFRAGAHEKALQYWKSPFKSPLVKNGEGFPGWHIECSAMGKKYLGDTIDLHMGGIEHIPTHHTNEIAQSEAANGKKFVGYWLHNEHLNYNGEKMAKSKGTGFALAEVAQKVFTPLALRYFFLSSQYRSKQNFTWEALEASEDALMYLYNQLNILGQTIGKIDEKAKKDFVAALTEDFNTPAALAAALKVLGDKKLDNADKLATLLDFDRVLGLDMAKMSKVKRIKETTEVDLTGKSEVRVFSEITLSSLEKDDRQAFDLIKAREEVRARKEWGESDRLRKEIEKRGVRIKDVPGGVEVYR